MSATLSDAITVHCAYCHHAEIGIGPWATHGLMQRHYADRHTNGGRRPKRDELAEAMRTGHYDAAAALSGEPFAIHTAEDCTDPWECQEQGWSRT